jgi:uncharacterized protein
MSQAQEEASREPSPVTPAQIEGPFYRPDAPYRTDLRMDDPEGETLRVSGTVRVADSHMPLKGAVLDVWQCDHLGHYDNSVPDFDATRYALRGKLKTDDHGRYVLETIVPANYPLGPDTPQRRAKHIHFKVFAGGYVPLTTQLYFADDPYLDLDPFADQTLAVKLRTHEPREDARAPSVANPLYSCRFDIMMSRASPVPAPRSRNRVNDAYIELGGGASDQTDGPSTVLLAAAKQGDVHAAREALAAGAAVNAKDEEGVTALMRACEGGHTPVARLLLERGADVNAQSVSGMMALMFCVGNPEKENLEIVRALLERGATVHQRERTQGLSALMLAAVSAHLDTVKALLEEEANASDSDTAGLTVLNYAVYGGSTAVVRLLLAGGADAAVTSLNGSTALMVVSPRSTPELVSLLVERGTPINAQNQRGGTALMAAAAAGNASLVKALLEHGAQVNLKSRTRWTALMWAAEAGSAAAVKYLLAKGAKVKAVNREGKTALELATAKNHQEVISLLAAGG